MLKACRLAAANLQVQRLQDRCDAAEADASLQRSLGATAKAQVTKLQQQLASRAEIKELEEKLRQSESAQACMERERLEEKRQVMELEEKVSVAERQQVTQAEALCQTEQRAETRAGKDEKRLADPVETDGAVALAVLRVAADRDPLESWDSEEAPAPSRAAAFLDCDGLGEDHVFWPIFRSALNLEGVLGQTTLELAIFGEQELPHFWPLVRAMGSEVKAISAAARISAEMLNFQAGIRPPYVPALSLHVEAAAQIVIMDASKKSLSFQEIGHYRLLALLPHVPYAQRLPDVFALGSPTLVLVLFERCPGVQESEEKCRAMQSTLDDVTQSASAFFYSATTRVTELEADRS
eukprot:g28401.t1